MDQQRLLELIDKLKNGTAEASEIAELDQYYHTFEKKSSYTNQLDKAQKEIYKAALFAGITTRLGIAAAGMPLKETAKELKLWPNLFRTAVAAAIFMVAGLGVYFYAVKNRISSKHTYANDIAPGKNTAVLTLANGKTITLSDAKNGVTINLNKLTYNDGTAVIATGVNDGIAAGMQSIATPRGGTYQIMLSDGTRVWLNAASELVFPANFGKSKKRTVKLSGEAYFEVAKDKAHAFVVNTNQQHVEVLGTHFNINSYADEGAVKTTLLEGSVRVAPHSGAPANEVVLKPNQEAVLSGTVIKVNEANIEEAMAWKGGMIMFKEENLKSIMRRVARWYNVEVDYQGDVSDQYFGGTLYRTEKISTLLNFFERTGDVKFEISGRRITVRRK